MNIYRLRSDDNYCGFTLIPGTEDEVFEFETLLDTPQPVNKPVPRGWIFDSGAKPVPDVYPKCWCLVMNQRAYEVLRPLLVISSEFMPAPLPDEELMVFHFTETLDALDFERSEVKYKESDPEVEQGETGAPEIDYIPTPVFREDVIGERVLFKLPYFTFPIYCTERFRAVVEENKLVGLTFRRVYPKMSPEEHEAFLEQLFGRTAKRKARTKRTKAGGAAKGRKRGKPTKGTGSRQGRKGTKRRKRGG